MKRNANSYVCILLLVCLACDWVYATGCHESNRKLGLLFRYLWPSVRCVK